MSKTAEEMFHEEFNVSTANGLVHTPPEFIISVMNRFAAQEVKAYKARLKEAILSRPAPEDFSMGIGISMAIKLIDTVK